MPNSPGVPAGCTQDTLVLRYNDTAALAEVFAAKGDKIAGVMLEPVVGNMGLVAAVAPSSARELRRLTQKHGALLIYDEVMTGFRLALRRGAGAARRHAGPDRASARSSAAASRSGRTAGGRTS